MNNYILSQISPESRLYPYIDDMVTSFDNNWNTNAHPDDILKELDAYPDKNDPAYKILVATAIRVYDKELPETFLTECLELDDFEVNLDTSSSPSILSFKDILRYHIVHKSNISEDFSQKIFDLWQDSYTIENTEPYKHVQWCMFCLKHVFERAIASSIPNEIELGLQGSSASNYSYMLQEHAIWRNVHKHKNIELKNLILKNLGDRELENIMSANLLEWVSDPNLKPSTRNVFSFITWCAGDYNVSWPDNFDIHQLEHVLRSLQKIKPTVYSQIAYLDTNIHSHHYRSAIHAARLHIDSPSASTDTLASCLLSIGVSNTWISHWLPLFKQNALDVLLELQSDLSGDHWFRIVQALTVSDLEVLKPELTARVNNLINLPVDYELDHEHVYTDILPKLEILNIDSKAFQTSLDLGSSLEDAVKIGYQTRLLPDSHKTYDLTF